MPCVLRLSERVARVEREARARLKTLRARGVACVQDESCGRTSQSVGHVASPLPARLFKA